MTSLSSEDLGWSLGLIPNLSVRAYPWMDGEMRGGQSRNARKIRTEKYRERQRDWEREGKRTEEVREWKRGKRVDKSRILFPLFHSLTSSLHLSLYPQTT